jgi:saccharopine dehydrogenase (NAD+, L-lysine-forming)
VSFCFSERSPGINADLIHRNNILRWDKAETLTSGLYSELLSVDILLNCIYLSGPISPFLSSPVLEKAGHTRRLSVVVDVSCDILSPFNPLPIYKLNTTFETPTLEVPVP